MDNKSSLFLSKRLNELKHLKNLDSNPFGMSDGWFSAFGRVDIEFICNDEATTICLITLDNKSTKKLFKGIARLYPKDKYVKEDGQKIAFSKAIEKFENYLAKVCDVFNDSFIGFSLDIIDQLHKKVLTSWNIQN